MILQCGLRPSHFVFYVDNVVYHIYVYVFVMLVSNVSRILAYSERRSFGVERIHATSSGFWALGVLYACMCF